MLAAALLAVAPGNHANAVNTNPVGTDNSASTHVVCIDDNPSVLDGGPLDPSPDGAHRP